MRRSDIIGADDPLDLLSADGTPRDRFVRRLIQHGPRCAGLAHHSVTAVQEHCIDLSAKADVAVVEGLFFLLEQIGQLADLLLKHDNLLAQGGVVLPLNVELAAAIH